MVPVRAASCLTVRLNLIQRHFSRSTVTTPTELIVKDSVVASVARSCVVRDATNSNRADAPSLGN